MPFVGPGEDERTRAARRERGRDLPAERGRLAVFAVSAAVEPDLGHHERTVLRHVLQTSEIGVEPVALLEKDVETHKVEEGQLEIFRRRVVDVGDESLGVLGLGRAVQSLEEGLNAPAAVPTHDRRRDLVSDRVTENRGVADARPHALAHPLLDRACTAGVVEEGDVLLPRHSDHHVEALSLGRVE